MRMASVALLVFCVLGCFAPQLPAGEAGAFSWPAFGRGKSTPQRTTNVSSTSKTPPIFSNLTNGTKRFVHDAKDWFTPDPPATKKRSRTVTRHADKPAPPKQSLFKRWFAPDPPPPPRTIDEWMSLDQVRP